MNSNAQRERKRKNEKKEKRDRDKYILLLGIILCVIRGKWGWDKMAHFPKQERGITYYAHTAK